MFPQWEWSGNEQATLYWIRLSLAPLDTCSFFPNGRNLWRAFFKCMRCEWAQRSLVETLLKFVPCQKEEFLRYHGSLLLSGFLLFFFFFPRHFFLLGWSVQIVLKVNTEMSKSDFYLSHNRDNSCWTLGWVPDLSWCCGVRLKMTCSKLKPNSFRWLIEFLIAKISSDVSVNECQSNKIKRHYLFNDW